MMTRQRPRHGCRFVDHRRAHWLHLDRVAGAVCEEDVQLIAFARDMRHTPLHQSRRPPPGLASPPGILEFSCPPPV